MRNTSEVCAADELYLRHFGSGLYHILTADSKNIKTVHVKMLEKQPFRIDLLKMFKIVNESLEVVEIDEDVDLNR